MLYSSNGYRTVVGYELARLNIATAVQAVGVKAPGRSFNGGDGGGDGGDAEEERLTRPVIAAAAEKERQTAVSCSQTRWQPPRGERELCSRPDSRIRACALENGSPGTPCSSTRR